MYTRVRSRWGGRLGRWPRVLAWPFGGRVPGLHGRQLPSYYDDCIRVPEKPRVLPGLPGRGCGDM
eukprot:11217080-Lingulodinium_polyedra.AAC.1